MDWKTRFPVGLALLAALMLAGGVSAATSMKLAAAQRKATVALAAHDESHQPGESDDPGENEPPDESPPPGETEPPDESGPSEGDDQVVPGGSVERFHEGCEFPEGAPAVEGNWNHGQYLSAFAKAGDHEALLAAAHSQCGKPLKADQPGKHKGKGKARGKGARSHGKSGHRGKNSTHHNS